MVLRRARRADTVPRVCRNSGSECFLHESSVRGSGRLCLDLSDRLSGNPVLTALSVILSEVTRLSHFPRATRTWDAVEGSLLVLCRALWFFQLPPFCLDATDDGATPGSAGEISGGQRRLRPRSCHLGTRILARGSGRRFQRFRRGLPHRPLLPFPPGRRRKLRHRRLPPNPRYHRLRRPIHPLSQWLATVARFVARDS